MIKDLTKLALSSLKNAKAMLNASAELLEASQLPNMAKNVFNEAKKMCADVHETLSDFKVDVEFDPDKDNLDYALENGIFHVVVNSKDGRSKTEKNITVPSNVNPKKMSSVYDEQKKVITFIMEKDKNLKNLSGIPSVSSFIDKFQYLKEDVQEFISTELPKTDDSSKNVNSQPNQSEATAEPANTEAAPEPIKRDAKGRFVSRKSKKGNTVVTKQ